MGEHRAEVTEPARAPGQQAVVVWHDVECGSYAEDLPLWRELADEANGQVLEVGCGTGRVALDLARSGHAVTAIDTDPALIAALRERARRRNLRITANVGDGRALALDGAFALIAMPMQVLQLLGGPVERHAALVGARELLAPGGLIVVALVEGVPGDGGEVAPLPDVLEIDGWVYSSLPLAITRDGERMLVTRLRQVVSPGGSLNEERDVTSLAVLDAPELEAEASRAGLRLRGRRTVPESAAHVESTVLLFGAVRSEGSADG